MITRDERFYDININTGEDFSLTFTVYGNGSTPVDLTGAVVSAQIREYPEGLTETDFACVHNGKGGQITISMAHEATAALGYNYGWFEVKVTFTDETEEDVMHGHAFIISSSTRLPSQGAINQVIAFDSFDDFPIAGSTYRIYLDQTTYNLYWWNGTQYVSLTNAMHGENATIRIGEVTTLEPGEDATVVNSGSLVNAILDFGIPRGERGYAGTINVGEVISAPAGSDAVVTNVGTEHDAVFDFRIPRGYAGFVAYATFDVDVTTGDLIMYSDADYVGANFYVTADGDLEVII